MRLFLCSVVLVGALTSTGCGAAISSYLILSAQSEVDGAEAAEAEKYAPYHYTAAKEYLHKAREEQGYAEFQPAIEFAYRAKEHAELGRAKAEQMKRDNVPPPAPPAPPAADTTIQPNPTQDETPRKTKPNIIIKKKAPVPAAPVSPATTGDESDATPPSATPPEKSPPAPKTAAPTVESTPPPTDQSTDDGNDNSDADNGGEAKKPRGPIIIPIHPSTGSGDS